MGPIQLAEALASYNADLAARIEAARKGELPDALRLFKAEKDGHDALDAQRKKLNEQLENLSRYTLPEMMEEKGVKTTTITYDGGINFRFTVAQRASCSMPDKEGGMAWLKENGHEGLIQETVNSGTLSAFAKDYVQTEGKDLPEFFKLSMMSYTSVTKA